MLARHVAAALPARVITSAPSQSCSLPAAFSRCVSGVAVLPDSTVKEQDIVLLRRVGKDYESLTKPLKHGRKLQTHFGSLAESDIIGKTYLENVLSSTREAIRIHPPTLGEYVRLTPRLVTPVYPDDANLIVSLLDIHVSPAPSGTDTQGDSRLDILEAGTGHGSLTLHLARAIHAANPPRQPSVAFETTEEDESGLSEWKARRRAVVHTIDRSAQFSAAAQKVVSGFRRGIYLGNVDFHVGDVTEFVERYTQGGQQQQPFSHVVLDLPDVQQHISTAAKALRDDGVLLVFCPSVTQIAQCVAAVRENRLPLSYSRVLELGPGLTGGRQWDVRAAKLRIPANSATASPANNGSSDSIWRKAALLVARLFGVKPADTKQPERWEMVCRPSVGHRVVGGGFVGVWRRKRIIGSSVEDSGGAAQESQSKPATQ